MNQDRKKFLQQLGGGLLMAGLPSAVKSQGMDDLIQGANDYTIGGAAEDEKFWKQVARDNYDLARDYINLENGYYGLQPLPVLRAFQRNVAQANSEGMRFARRIWPGVAAEIKKELAAFLHVSDEEITLTRNATEALNIAIQGYPFKPGDEVLICQLDYFSMIETFQMLEKRGQIKVNAIELPLASATEEELIEIYSKAITEKTKVILLTQVSNINGLIVPVAKIAAIAKQKGIDIICDSAHALGHIKFSLPELGCDFVGMNLHKWIGNPIGAGVLYVKKDRIKEMKVMFGDVNASEESITKLAHFGTTLFAVTMTIPSSLAFHQQLGIDRISQRLHYLKNIWMDELKNEEAVEILTPPGLSCAIASFRIRNKKTSEVVDYLFNQHKVLTVGRTLGKEGCIRVTPGLYSSPEDVKKLAVGVREYVKG